MYVESLLITFIGETVLRRWTLVYCTKKKKKTIRFAKNAKI